MALNHEGTYYVALRLIAWNSLSVDNHPVATLRSPDPHSPGLLLVFDSKEAARAFFDEDVALVALCTGSAATPKEIAVERLMGITSQRYGSSSRKGKSNHVK